MIGREGPVDHFDLVKWARRMAGACSLRPTEAHVLLVLATYANEDAEAWPSLRTIAYACGRTPTKNGTCSSISRALVELESRELVFSTQGGKGRTAKRELLFDPATPMRPAPGWEVDQAPLPSRMEETIGERSDEQAFSFSVSLLSHLGETEEPVEELQEPVKKNQESFPVSGKACHPSHGKASEPVPDEERQRVRLQIVKSLSDAEAAA